MDKSYSVWRILPNGQIIQSGILALTLADSKKITKVRFQYAPAYLSQGLAPLDPVNAPLQSAVIHYETNGELPGFVDDCMPDAWGEKIIAASRRQSFLSKADILDDLPSASIGDTLITGLNDRPIFDLGLNVESLKALEASNFNDNLDRLNVDYVGLKVLLQGGSGVGGARPKLLVDEEGKSFIYKFNRTSDVIDVAANEWASLEVMRQAGLDVCEADVSYLLGRKFLKVKRFDITEKGRYWLLSINSLLKTPLQEDTPFPSYDSIAKLIKRHSISVKKDLKQLVSQALFNRELNNTDDHLRNFSFINRGPGYQLSPAYDVLPSDTIGTYHQLTLNQSFIPSLDQADLAISNGDLRSFLGLSKKDSQQIVGAIRESIQDFDRLVKVMEGL